MVKILSNFDTEFDDICVNDAISQFGKDDICFIRRDRIYILLKIGLPTFFWLLFSTLLIAIAYGSGLGKTIGYTFQVFIWIIICGTGCVLLRKVTAKLIDYYMDFTIITPKQITAYDQTGIFTRNARSLDITKIKSVRIEKSGLLRSIFNFGSIVFFAEGDEHSGDITLNFISDPNKLSKRLQEIIHIES